MVKEGPARPGAFELDSDAILSRQERAARFVGAVIPLGDADTDPHRRAISILATTDVLRLLAALKAKQSLLDELADAFRKAGVEPGVRGIKELATQAARWRRAYGEAIEEHPTRAALDLPV